MRFLFLVYTDYEGGPTPELMTAMHELAEREVAAGRMIADAGLAPAATGKRVGVKGRKLTVTDGPFAETKEVIGGFALFELPDMAAAVESARQFMDLHREHMPDWEGTCEIRAVVGSQVELLPALAIEMRIELAATRLAPEVDVKGEPWNERAGRDR